jgi:hypothetical protein
LEDCWSSYTLTRVDGSSVEGFDTLEQVEVAFEATYGWGRFADLLGDVGIPTHMAKERPLSRAGRAALSACDLSHASYLMAHGR